MTSRAPGEELGGAVHAKESSFQGRCASSIRTQGHGWHLLCGLSMKSALGREET